MHRRSFLRSLGIAVMAVSLDFLPRFDSLDPNYRILAVLDSLIEAFAAPIPTFRIVDGSLVLFPAMAA